MNTIEAIGGSLPVGVGKPVAAAGTTTRFSFGDDESLADSYVWYAGTAHGKPQDVGTKQPNPWGLYDMHGGVGEMRDEGASPEVGL